MKNANSAHEVINFLKQIIAEEIKEPEENIGEDQHFFELGFDSISSLYLLEKIERHFNIQIDQLYFWDYPTIRTFSEQIFKEKYSK